MRSLRRVRRIRCYRPCPEERDAEVPARIDPPQRIVLDVAVPVEALRGVRARHDRIGLEEAPERGVVPAGSVVVDVARVVVALPGKAELGCLRARPGAGCHAPAKGQIRRALEHERGARAGGLGHEHRAAQMIAVAVDDALARVGARGGLGAVAEAVAVGIGVIEGGAVLKLDVVGNTVAVAVEPEGAEAKGQLLVGRELVAVDVRAVQGPPEQGLIAWVYARARTRTRRRKKRAFSAHVR